MRYIVFLLAYLSVIPIADALQFSEVSADPQGPDDSREWIEAYGETNLTGWRLLEGGTEHRLSRFGGNETVHPTGYFIIADDAAAFVNEASYNGTVYDSSFSLSNAGETLVLKNDTHNVTLTYNATLEGLTFCLYNGTWTSCEPTPGYENKIPVIVKINTTNETENTIDIKEAQEEFTIISYPQRVQFGSRAFVTVRTDAGTVYAYGYPKRVLEREELVVTNAGEASVPLVAKDNCSGTYRDGSYRIRVRNDEDVRDLQIEFYGQGDCEEIAFETAEVKPTVRIVNVPEATLGESFRTSIIVMANGDFEIYSYLRDGRTLASRGGWTANKRALNVSELGYVELALTPTRTGNITLVVRLKDGEKKYEDVRIVGVKDDSEENITSESREVRTEPPRQFVPVQQKKGAWNAFISALRGWIY